MINGNDKRPGLQRCDCSTFSVVSALYIYIYILFRNLVRSSSTKHFFTALRGYVKGKYAAVDRVALGADVRARHR